MLIGYLGIAGSGKSTIACNLFSKFKLDAQNTELILEEARRFISEYRFKNQIPHNQPVSLTDKDQTEIAARQFNIEKNFKHSCGPTTIIISDSSSLNSLLYINDSFLKETSFDDYLFTQLKGHYDLLFFCHPIDFQYLPHDSNRIHNKEQLEKIDLRAKELLIKLKNRGFPVYELMDDSESRIRDAGMVILDKYCQIIETTPDKDFQLLN
jgi:hypothetical protein